MRIANLVRRVLKTGYLTKIAEDELRQLLTTKYDLEDFQAFMQLQFAAADGHIRQQSREEREK